VKRPGVSQARFYSSTSSATAAPQRPTIETYKRDVESGLHPARHRLRRPGRQLKLKLRVQQNASLCRSDGPPSDR
jgi:hypothetical protein